MQLKLTHQISLLNQFREDRLSPGWTDTCSSHREADLQLTPQLLTQMLWILLSEREATGHPTTGVVAWKAVSFRGHLTLQRAEGCICLFLLFFCCVIKLPQLWIHLCGLFLRLIEHF